MHLLLLDHAFSVSTRCRNLQKLCPENTPRSMTNGRATNSQDNGSLDISNQDLRKSQKLGQSQLEHGARI